MILLLYMNSYILPGFDVMARPADDQDNMIPPDQFENYRKERHLKYPCCLCPDGGT